MFDNAMAFNPKDNWVYAIAANLRDFFENTWIECTMRMESKKIIGKGA